MMVMLATNKIQKKKISHIQKINSTCGHDNDNNLHSSVVVKTHKLGLKCKHKFCNTKFIMSYIDPDKYPLQYCAIIHTHRFAGWNFWI